LVQPVASSQLSAEQLGDRLLWPRKKFKNRHESK